MAPKTHVVVVDKDANTRRSYDIEDSGIKGVGSNWVSISDAHYTNQNEPKHSSERHEGDTSKSEDIYK